MKDAALPVFSINTLKGGFEMETIIPFNLSSGFLQICIFYWKGDYSALKEVNKN